MEVFLLVKRYADIFQGKLTGLVGERNKIYAEKSTPLNYIHLSLNKITFISISSFCEFPGVRFFL